MSGPFPISDKPVRCHLLRSEKVMRRREFIGLVAGATTWARGARGQQAANVRRIGVLSPFAPADTVLWNKAFLRGLRDVGWVDGKNLAIEYRFAEGKKERLPELVTDLIQKKVDVAGYIDSSKGDYGYPNRNGGCGRPCGDRLC
jgi:hypothetical protein